MLARKHILENALSSALEREDRLARELQKVKKERRELRKEVKRLNNERQ